MKNKILILICSLWSLFSYGQPGFQSYTCTPHNPSTNDHVIITDSMGFPDSGNGIVYRHINFTDSLILINYCFHHYGGSQIQTFKKDTIDLGLFNRGNYHVKMYLRWILQTPDTDCSVRPPDDSISFTFSVDYPASLSEIEMEALLLFPNPTNGILYLSVALHDAELEISDMTGRVFDTPYTEREIDVSSLAKGAYTLRLRNKEGMAVRRFVKE